MDSNNVTPNKLDVYEMVTNRIIELLEKGTIPWRQPWKDAGIPMNLLSKRQYRGINLWLLLSLNYENNLFLTWDQIKSIKASVKQGEQGHPVIFWRTIPKKKQSEDETEAEKQVPFLRYYKVWNVSQVRDIPKDLLLKRGALPEGEDENTDGKSDPFFPCQPVIHGMPQCPPIYHNEQKAYYHRKDDYINMPKKRSFKKGESYYSILFHELIHSTGHEKRLNRSFSADMAETGGDKYSLEELVAELGACYLCSHCGILPSVIDNNAAYIKAWLNRLKDDKKFIIHASGHAQRAVDFILNEKQETRDQKDEVEQPELLSGD